MFLRGQAGRCAPLHTLHTPQPACQPVGALEISMQMVLIRWASCQAGLSGLISVKALTAQLQSWPTLLAPARRSSEGHLQTDSLAASLPRLAPGRLPGEQAGPATMLAQRQASRWAAGEAGPCSGPPALAGLGIRGHVRMERCSLTQGPVLADGFQGTPWDSPLPSLSAHLHEGSSTPRLQD